MRYLLLALSCFFFLSFAACDAGESADRESADQQGKTTVFYFTRHAEKMDGQDPGLAPAGVARANRLVTQLANEKVAAVYATGYRRTQETAAPIAQQHGLSVMTYDARAAANEVTRSWLKQHRGQTILVVGHSNTVPGLVNALLGEKRFSDIDEGDYDKLFKVTVGSGGKATVSEMSSGK